MMRSNVATFNYTFTCSISVESHSSSSMCQRFRRQLVVPGSMGSFFIDCY